MLDSIERDQAAEIIKKYGGRVTSAVSKKTDYLVSFYQLTVQILTVESVSCRYQILTVYCVSVDQTSSFGYLIDFQYTINLNTSYQKFKTDKLLSMVINQAK